MKDKKPDETPTQTTESTPDSNIGDFTSEGVKHATRSAGEELVKPPR